MSRVALLSSISVILGCPKSESGQCASDLECPGSQVCSSRRCTSAPGGECATDYDCSEEDVCIEHRCSSAAQPSPEWAAIETNDPQFGAVAVHRNGERLLAITSRDASGSIAGVSGALWFDANGNVAFVDLGTDGLPTLAVVNNTVIVFGNYTSDHFDAVVLSGSKPQVLKGVESDSNVISELRAARWGKQDNGYGLTVAKAIRIASLAIPAFLCVGAFASVIALPIGSTCIGAVFSIVAAGTEDPGVTLVSTFFGIIGCGSGAPSCLSLVLKSGADKYEMSQVIIDGKTSDISLAKKMLAEGICTPSCIGKSCGSDWCGGSCGVCPDGMQCDGVKCVGECQPSCVGMQCGNDGCGGSCGKCSSGDNCINGACVSDPEQCAPSAGCQKSNCVFYDDFSSAGLDTQCKWAPDSNGYVSSGVFHVHAASAHFGLGFDKICTGDIVVEVVLRLNSPIDDAYATIQFGELFLGYKEESGGAGYKCGNSDSLFFNAKPLTPDIWHKVIAKRTGSVGTLSIDQVQVKASACSQENPVVLLVGGDGLDLESISVQCF